MPIPLADLSDQLETPQCHCMNEKTEHNLRHCLDADSREDSASYLESDADEELMIQLKFMSAVKISAIRIEGKDKDSAPSVVRLFVNKTGLDFDSAKDEKPTQEIELSPSDVAPGAAKPKETRFVLFQNVSTLGIFIGANQGDEETTALKSLMILGEPIQQSGLKRSAEQQAASSAGDWLGGGIKEAK